MSHQAGLPNWFNGNFQYVAKAREGFDYSGEAYCFLNEVLENKTGKSLNKIAEEEFKKLKMHDSSFLPVAREFRAIGHNARGMVDNREHHLSHRANPAASLFTTAADYGKFLKACVKDEFVREHMFKPQVDLEHKDKKAIEAGISSNVLQHLSWGLGIGLCRREDGSTIAFHWGDVETCRSLAVINLNTSDIVTCFSNSANAPRLFQQIAEPVVGSLGVIPEWLSRREGLEMAKEKVFSHQIQHSNLNETSSASNMQTPLKNPFSMKLKKK